MVFSQPGGVASELPILRRPRRICRTDQGFPQTTLRQLCIRLQTVGAFLLAAAEMHRFFLKT